MIVGLKSCKIQIKTDFLIKLEDVHLSNLNTCTSTNQAQSPSALTLFHMNKITCTNT